MTRRVVFSLALALSPLALVILTFPTVPQRTASAKPPKHDHDEGVGLSLFFQDGAMAPITLVGNTPRYLQEVDIVVNTPPSNTDDGIAPLINQGEFSTLDWTGVAFVEEDWRSTGDGKFQRQRFYRGARWMTRPSQFQLLPTDNAGHPLGPPLTAHAGKDDRWLPSDDGFVRRFVVRQVARNCPAINDTTGATFTVQGLVQLRDALHPDEVRSIPHGTTQLRLKWTEQPGTTRTVQVSHALPSAYPFGYGFEPRLSVTNPPANGQFYLPGDTLQVKTSFLDGRARPLYPSGVLPSYNTVLSGQDPAGLRYYDGFRLNPTLFYALKHREANLFVTISGPTDRLKIPTQTVDTLAFFFGPASVATVATDGWSSIATTVPPPQVLLGGLINPALWDLPASDVSTVPVPADALPGTYVLALKARREFGGEALNRTATIDIQVGSANLTTYSPKVGHCNRCHDGPTGFAKILHGVTDFRACYTCHAATTVEPDGLLDLRVHFVHDRSARFRSVGGDIHNCTLCHLTPPGGPAKGLLNP